MAKQRFHSASEINANPELAKGLLGHAEALLAIEEQVAALRAHKAELFDQMRDEYFDPAHAKAFVADKLKDPEKAEKERLAAVDRAIVVGALTEAERVRARARACATTVPAHDPVTGEIHDLNAKRAA